MWNCKTHELRNFDDRKRASIVVVMGRVIQRNVKNLCGTKSNLMTCKENPFQRKTYDVHRQTCNALILFVCDSTFLCQNNMFCMVFGLSLSVREKKTRKKNLNIILWIQKPNQPMTAPSDIDTQCVRFCVRISQQKINFTFDCRFALFSLGLDPKRPIFSSFSLHRESHFYLQIRSLLAVTVRDAMK